MKKKKLKFKRNLNKKIKNQLKTKKFCRIRYNNNKIKKTRPKLKSYLIINNNLLIVPTKINYLRNMNQVVLQIKNKNRHKIFK